MKGIWMRFPHLWKEFGGRKLKMYDVSKLFSITYMPMLKVITIKLGVLGYTLEVDNMKSPKKWCRKNSKTNISPLKIKRPPPNLLPKYPHSHQFVRNGHVENEEDGQSVYSQQMEKNHPHQREYVCNQ